LTNLDLIPAIIGLQFLTAAYIHSLRDRIKELESGERARLLNLVLASGKTSDFVALQRGVAITAHAPKPDRPTNPFTRKPIAEVVDEADDLGIPIGTQLGI
jgi:hypothetical protein